MSLDEDLCELHGEQRDVRTHGSETTACADNEDAQEDQSLHEGAFAFRGSNIATDAGEDCTSEFSLEPSATFNVYTLPYTSAYVTLASEYVGN